MTFHSIYVLSMARPEFPTVNGTVYIATFQTFSVIRCQDLLFQKTQNCVVRFHTIAVPTVPISESPRGLLPAW